MKWLLQHGFHEKALAVVEEGKARTELLEEVYPPRSPYFNFK